MSDAPFNPTGWSADELAELERAWTPRREPAPLLAEIRRATLQGRAVLVLDSVPPDCFDWDRSAYVLEPLYQPYAPVPWDLEDARRQAERVKVEYPAGTKFIPVGFRAKEACRGILEG